MEHDANNAAFFHLVNKTNTLQIYENNFLLHIFLIPTSLTGTVVCQLVIKEKLSSGANFDLFFLFYSQH